MPQEEGHFSYGHLRKGHGHAYITTAEAAGIGILTVILGILLLIGCWYCRRRSGYRTLTEKSLDAGAQSTLQGRCAHEGLGHRDTKLSSQEKNSEALVPNAPPTYEKLSGEHSPPPYSP
ncbi:melanoma antigen recognized by T-cells 1 [Octodon degus]|uniref:Melanoma antigen recognized by T-cells 1 n=1 Tax=Octodon degus TaxID=10160 RepID=A0A6P3FD53_OCTDE|nr:melanoma antigen recognized by T-cells 1 [Octodon degus]